jgi:hypothetical protein
MNVQNQPEGQRVSYMIFKPILLYKYVADYRYLRSCLPNVTKSLVGMFLKCAIVAIFLLYHFSQVSKCVIKYYWVRDQAGHQMVENDLFP